MKSIYFVRHGESMGNINNAYQGSDESLSEEGIRQAGILAERFLRIPVDVVLASTHKRAHQTAEIVNAIIRKPIEFRNDLVEMRKPSEMWGKPTSDEKAQEIQKFLINHDHESDWHYSDEENFFDRKARVSRVVDILLEKREQTILVVSYGTIIRTIVIYMLLGDDLTSHNYYQNKFLYDFYAILCILPWLGLKYT